MSPATDRSARIADDWWASLDSGRRAQIHQWIAGRDAHTGGHSDIDGQADLFDCLDRTRP